MGQFKSRKEQPDKESSIASKNECNSTVLVYIHRCGLEYKENSSNDINEGKWNDLLDDLATKLLPDIEYYQRGIIMASRVFSIIKCCRNDVLRVKIGGSVGKHIGISTRCLQTQKTEEINSEFDLYVFLANSKPPFDKVMEEFKSHLESLKQFLPGLCWLSENKNSANSKTCINFKIESKVYHLYPAANFVEILDCEAFTNMDSFIQTCITESKHFVELQRIGVLREIEKVEDFEQRFYYSSLEESSVRFFKNIPRHIRKAIRLIRFWNQSINSLQYPSIDWKTNDHDKTCNMLDLCAVKAALLCPSDNLHDLLRKAMELLIDFHNLCIIFQMDEDKITEYDKMKIDKIEGKLIIDMDFPSPLNSKLHSNVKMNEIDGISLIKKTFIHTLPCVLDPWNPFNNFADLELEGWEVLRRRAKNLFVRLEENMFQNDEMIQKIFEND